MTMMHEDDYRAGDMIAGYEVLGFLGAGGMAKVYKVRNLVSRRIEAMKVVRTQTDQDADLIERFLRENRILADLEHPGIVSLRTSLKVAEHYVMFMEYVEGDTVDALLRSQGCFSVQQTIAYANQMLSALAYAHSRGVIHRDLKPGNVMIGTNGVLKLMDFGISKLLSDPAIRATCRPEAELTAAGLLIGSPFYIAPEQIEGHPASFRSDLYSLGVMLYEMSTGRRPIEGETISAVMQGHLHRIPVPPIELVQPFAEQFNDIILRALAKNPADRFPSAEVFQEALNRTLEPAVESRQVSVHNASNLPVGTEGMHRHRARYLFLGAVVALALTFVGAIELPRWFHAGAEMKLPPPVTHSLPPPNTSSTSLQPANTPRSTTVTKHRRQVANTPVGNDPAQVATPQSGSQASETQARREASDRLIRLRAREQAISESLDRLRQSLGGLGLRSDIAIRWQSAGSFLSKSDRLLSTGQVEEAIRNMDASEQDLQGLERSLGHK
jgi:serine/threonine protein kinase